MKKDINTEFKDINKESNYRNYVIVIILYIIVIILTVLLILGLKNQKDIVKNELEDNMTAESIEIKEDTKVQEVPETNENLKPENFDKNSDLYDYSDELNILDQM